MARHPRSSHLIQNYIGQTACRIGNKSPFQTHDSGPAQGGSLATCLLIWALRSPSGISLIWKQTERQSNSHPTVGTSLSDSNLSCIVHSLVFLFYIRPRCHGIARCCCCGCSSYLVGRSGPLLHVRYQNIALPPWCQRTAINWQLA